MSDDEASMGLVLAFDSDDPEFTRGFEAGALWARLGVEYRIDQMIHASNAEMVMRMAEAKGYTFEARGDDPAWVDVTLVMRGATGA